MCAGWPPLRQGAILNWSGDVKPSISVERLIAQQNILRFERLLETEFDPATRANLVRLLLQEEDKLGQILGCKMSEAISSGGAKRTRRRWRQPSRVIQSRNPGERRMANHSSRAIGETTTNPSL